MTRDAGGPPTSTGRLVLAAACFALALGLPFGRTARTVHIHGPALAQPLLVQDWGGFGYDEHGTVVQMPSRLRMQYVPLFMPGVNVTATDSPLGRTTTARVPLVALVLAATLALRRRSPALARRAAFAGGVALALTGVVAALPTPGAVASIVGVVLLATIRARGRDAHSAPSA